PGLPGRCARGALAAGARMLSWWQLDQTGFIQPDQQLFGADILGSAIGLVPGPGPAELKGQLVAGLSRVLGNQEADKRQVFRCHNPPEEA
ncbi:MAG: hypothetical protein AB1801_23990, partial [Chloroflexota bacterium]